jgi:hypothetical protein
MFSRSGVAKDRPDGAVMVKVVDNRSRHPFQDTLIPSGDPLSQFVDDRHVDELCQLLKTIDFSIRFNDVFKHSRIPSALRY